MRRGEEEGKEGPYKVGGGAPSSQPSPLHLSQEYSKVVVGVTVRAGWVPSKYDV